MTTLTTPNLFKLLAHDIRWQLLQALALSDRRVQELAAALRRPQNLISYHLRQLRAQQLIHERRSSYDARDVYYTLDVAQVQRLYHAAGAELHPAVTPDATPADETTSPIAPVRVLFLCTHNSARSQLAEGILRARGGARVAAFSAGSQPTAVHPLAVQAAARLGIDISRQSSQHLEAYVGQRFDYVITVCDRVREMCPVFPHDPQQIHWSFPDPAAVEGSEATRLQAFLQTARELNTRIQYLLLMIERKSYEYDSGRHPG